VRRYLIALAVFLLVAGALAIPEIVVVPSATGTYAAAVGRLKDAGLRVAAIDIAGRTGEPHDLSVVVRQDPAAGSLRPPGTRVTLWTRAPTATVVVPNVVGLEVSVAEQVIHDAGLFLYDTGGLSSQGVTVAVTVPKSGKTVPFGTTVVCMLSSPQQGAPNSGIQTDAPSARR
jgi:beta-lactam-binding protein with PASTA domain